MKAKPPVTPRKPSPKHQHLKIALIPVLLLVLAYVIFTLADEPAVDDVPVEKNTGRSTVAAVANTAQPAAVADAQLASPAKMQAWPEADLDFLNSSNPFKSFGSEAAGPTSSRFVSANAQHVGDTVDQLANIASDLEQRPVNFVFRSSKQNVIMLGDEVLEKGSQLSPAVQLQDIGDHALLLKLHP